MPYTSDLERALEKIPIEAKTTYLGRGEDPAEGPDNPHNKPWKYFEWSVELRYAGGTMLVPSYKCGLAHAKRTPRKGSLPRQSMDNGVYDDQPELVRVEPTPPSLADVMSSVLGDSDAMDCTFDDFAEGLGYSNDSIKALFIYLACQRVGTQIVKLLGRARVELLRSKEH